MFTIDFTKPWLYKDVSYFNQGNLSSNNILRCKVITGGDTTLEDYIGVVTFDTLSRKEINGVCNIVDAKNCVIDIHFPSNALEIGENTLEIILTKGSGSNKVVAQSPMIKYEVWRGITTGNGVQSENNYPILIDLISKVNNTVRIANNASATADASLKQTAKMLEDVDNTLVKANNTINATNNAKNEALEAVKDVKKAIAAGTQDLEVKNARGKYDTLNERFDNLDKDLLNIKDTAIIQITTESNFVTVEETLNGYFENIKLEGKTLVNRGGTINTQFDKYGEILNASLQPNTLYTMRVVNKGANEIKFYPNEHVFKDGRTLTLAGNSATTIKICTLPSVIGTALLKSSSENGTLFNIEVLCLEGEFEEFPSFFTGMKSVGDDIEEIVVSSCNSGKFIIENIERDKFIDYKTGNINFTPNWGVSDFIEVQEGLQIIQSIYYNSPAGGIAFYDFNKEYISGVNANKTIGDFKIVTPKGTRYFRCCDKSDKINVYFGNKNEFNNICKVDKKKVLYYDTETQTWKKPVLREWDSVEESSDGKYYYYERSGKRIYQDGDESDSSVITDKTNTIYKLGKEKIYECAPIDLISFENETNYMIECGPIIPKTTLKCQSYIGNVINTLKEKVSYLEDKLYKTNLANFTVALNALDTKLKLEQLTRTPK